MEDYIYNLAPLFIIFCVYKILNANVLASITSMKTEIRLKKNFVSSFYKLPVDKRPEVQVDSEWPSDTGHLLQSYVRSYPLLVIGELIYLIWIIVGALLTTKWFYFAALFIMMKSFRVFYRDLIYYSTADRSGKLLTIVFILSELLFVYLIIHGNTIEITENSLIELSSRIFRK
jgi:hypothetical protein